MFYRSFLILFLLFVVELKAFAATEAQDTGSTFLSFIDVGDGDSILLESGGESALIDSGNLISTYNLSEYLKQRKIQKLDALILTHPHADHIGGSFFILEAFKPGFFADNGEEVSANEADIYRWYGQLRKNNQNYRQLKKGDQLKIGKALLKVLWPPQPGVTSDWNSNSLVISLEIAGFRALLMGDANQMTETALLESGISLKADIFKAGHHGAKDCCKKEFIDLVSPGHCVISVNKGNLEGKPDAGVVRRLREKSDLLMTSEKGTIVFEIQDNGSYKVLPE